MMHRLNGQYDIRPSHPFLTEISPTIRPLFTNPVLAQPINELYNEVHGSFVLAQPINELYNEVHGSFVSQPSIWRAALSPTSTSSLQVLLHQQAAHYRRLQQQQEDFLAGRLYQDSRRKDINGNTMEVRSMSLSALAAAHSPPLPRYEVPLLPSAHENSPFSSLVSIGSPAELSHEGTITDRETQNSPASFVSEQDSSTRETETDVAVGLVQLMNQGPKENSEQDDLSSSRDSSKHNKAKRKSRLSQPHRVGTRNAKFNCDGKLTSTWRKRFEELLEFEKEHGHNKVPFNYPPNTALSAWVQTQRKKKRLCQLSKEQVTLLDQIGFHWSTKHENIAKSLLEKYDGRWMERYKQLEQYHTKYGHCKVDDSQPRLRSWLYRQRKLHELGSIPVDRLALLERLGFDTKTTTETAKRIQNQKQT